MSRILVVDDNADTITLLKAMLEKWGFEVISGHNGEEGLDLVSSAQPDAIISNVRMPRMDGLTFLEQVRVRAEWSSIPFVMMSGLFPEEFGAKAIQQGANGFLAKPFRFADLNNLIQNLNLS